MRKRVPVRWLAVLTAAAVPALGVTAASASLPPGPHSHSLTAVTRLVNRDDSGNGTPNPDWAKDNFTRTLTITPQGPAALTDCGITATACYAFQAKIADDGFFTTVPGDFTPNQSAPYTGALIRSRVTGELTGYSTYAEFYATVQPDPSLVPHFVNGDADPTSGWPLLAFPAGTTYSAGAPATVTGGLGEPLWSWSYTALVRTHDRWHRQRFQVQHWVDASYNNYGDSPGDGNITG